MPEQVQIKNLFAFHVDFKETEIHSVHMESCLKFWIDCSSNDINDIACDCQLAIVTL